MSTVTTIIIIFSILATTLFCAGFIRGVRNALASFHLPDDQSEVTDLAHWPSVIFAVVASALVIAAVGFSPAFIYAGPFLVILSGAATGLAFFLEDQPVQQTSQVKNIAELASA